MSYLVNGCFLIVCSTALPKKKFRNVNNKKEREEARGEEAKIERKNRMKEIAKKWNRGK